MTFPVSPTDGESTVVNNITYTYSSATGAWTRVAYPLVSMSVVGNIIAGNIIAGGARSTSSATPPSSPTVGDIWYDTATDVIYRYTNDGTSSYWIDEFGSTAGVTGVNNATYIANGTSSVSAASSGNVTTAVAGSNIMVTSSSGISVTGNISASGNVTAGNIGLSYLSVTGNIDGGNVNVTTVSATGNVDANSMNAAGNVTVTGNVQGMFYVNPRTISASVTIGNINTMTTGPIIIADGITVTINTGGEWSIV